MASQHRKGVQERAAPGMTEGFVYVNGEFLPAAQATISVYGSSGAENTYIVDGVNTTGVEYGFQGKELNFEFVEAIDIKTGGYEAEYGRSTGGVINVITKSGGNEFKGDVFGYFDDDSLQAGADTVVSKIAQATGPCSPHSLGTLTLSK